MTNSTMNRMRGGLHLDKRNGWLGGVCAGLADFFDIDPALIRVGVIVSALFVPKLVIAAYLACWLLLDER